MVLSTIFRTAREEKFEARPEGIPKTNPARRMSAILLPTSLRSPRIPIHSAATAAASRNPVTASLVGPDDFTKFTTQENARSTIDTKDIKHAATTMITVSPGPKPSNANTPAHQAHMTDDEHRNAAISRSTTREKRRSGEGDPMPHITPDACNMASARSPT